MCTAVQRKGQVFHLSAAELALRFAGLSPRLFFTFPRVSPFRAARFAMRTSQTPLLAPPSASLVFGSASVVAAPSYSTGNRADDTVAPIAVLSRLISNGTILSARGHQTHRIRLSLLFIP